MTHSSSSAADFLLAPEVQKLLRVFFAEPDKAFPVKTLAKLTRLEPSELERTLEHLLQCGILRRHAAEAQADGEAGPVSANTTFVFYRELRSIALKSFAAAEPLRAMLRSKFKDSVLQAVLLGEDADGALSVLIVHGEKVPEEAAMSSACQKLRASLGRHLQVRVLSHAAYEAYAARHGLAQRLAAGDALQIIAPGETRAKAGPAGGGLLRAARARLSAALKKSA